MLEMKDNRLQFSFPEVHAEAKFDISFQRTLRIPDDGRPYPLPPGLGRFPVRHVDDFKEKVPAKWIEHGGVMMPLYQSEALWLMFEAKTASGRRSAYPMAVKISTGKVSAVTGEPWASGLMAKDYVVAPIQRWLDGYAIGDGLVRQFVAAPLGSGFTAEEQITGKAEHGGTQIEVIPMKAEAYERRFPKQVYDSRIRRRSIGATISAASAPTEACAMGFESSDDDSIRGEINTVSEIGLAPGGTMKQQIHADPFDINDWDVERGTRVFVHLVNSLVWRSITGQVPPHPEFTAADYTRNGLPWFEHYVDGASTLQGTSKLTGMQSVAQMSTQKGIPFLPENKSVEVKSEAVKQLADKPKNPNAVREGSW